jgi:hypothetical protein
MSIIHDALRRKEQAPNGAVSAQGGVTGFSGTGAASANGGPASAGSVPAPASKIAQFYPAIIGGGAVVLAALVTYLISRPGEITVVVSPPPGMSATQSTALAAGAPGSPNASNPGYMYQPWQTGTPVNPLVPQPGTPVAPLGPGAMPGTALPPAANLPPTAVPPLGPDAAIPYADPEPSFRSIPVYHGATLTNPQPAQPATPRIPSTDLPPNAVTIEMSEASLASQTGGVTINGAPSQPGAKLRVGSEIRTDQTGGATVNFSRASVDLSQASAARISRLERRVSTSGAAEEEVTIHLNQGSAHTVVQQGQGSVLVSTPALTAATQSGAFTVATHADGSVSVRSEGGSVRLVPTERQNESYMLRPNETVVYRNGQWVKQQ